MTRYEARRAAIRRERLARKRAAELCRLIDALRMTAAVASHMADFRQAGAALVVIGTQLMEIEW